MSIARTVFAHPSYTPAADIARTLADAQRILITAHANPDGDAIGSMAALGLGLKGMGKAVALANATGLPGYLNWLTLPGRIHTGLHGLGFKPDVAVVLDCGDAERLGSILAADIRAFPCINVDHHLGNPHFGTAGNWCEPRMAATGQMVAAILDQLDVPLTGNIAEAVYLAISSDSGGFSFDNTTEELLLLAAHLVGQGLNVAQVRQQMDNQWSLPRMRLWAHVMARFALHRQGSIALAAVSMQDLAACHARKEDLEGFVEHMRKLRGVQVSALVREDHPGRCKLSLRSTGPVDVRAITAHFGGGGHRNAAGATLKQDLTQSCPMVLAAIESWLDENKA